jgi:hypothetical protein
MAHKLAEIYIRLPEEKAEQLKEDAYFSCVSVSELIRKRCQSGCVISQTDQLIIKELRGLGKSLKDIYEKNKIKICPKVTKAINEIENYIKMKRG